MNVIYIKAYDTAISFTDTLAIDDVPYDLTGATVKFIISRQVGLYFEADATIVAPTSAATVTYSPTSGFPTTPGMYKQEWEVTNSTGVLTFPSLNYNLIVIQADLNQQ